MSERIYSVDTVALKIDGFLQPVLEQGGFELTFDIVNAAPAEDDFETPDVIVRFEGKDVDMLLSNRAELLLGLEHLTMEMLRIPSEHHSKISFDANDYRMLRIEELRLSAGAAADRVKSSGQPFLFNPMNSRERRVIHLSLRNETDLRSESLGSGPMRGVVVYPAGMPSLPEPPPTPYAARPSVFGPDRDRERERESRERGPGGPGGRGGDRGRGGGDRDRRRSGPPRRRG